MKRIFTVLTVLLLLTLSFCGRMLYLAVAPNELPKITNSHRKILISSLRGEVLDVNGYKLVNRHQKRVIIAKPCKKSAEILEEYLNEDEYIRLLECIEKSVPFICECDYSEDDDFIKQATIYERYFSDGFCCHVLGYINSADNIGVYGIEKSFQKILTEEDKKLYYTYNLSGYGEALAGGQGDIESVNYYSQRGVRLTIDSSIQRISENALSLYGVERGAVVVLDAKSGEIRAMVSAPKFNQNNVASSLENKNSPFLNRAVNAYSVGSVFKIVVASAAIKMGIDDFESYCNGDLKISEQTFSCSDNKSHGEVTLEKALAYSCNTYFIRLALKIGAEKLIKTAESLGFGKNFLLAENFYSSAGRLPKTDEVSIGGNLANLSFGQGGLLASPLQIASCYSAVVTGTFLSPKLVISEIDKDGVEREINTSRYKYRAFSEDETLKLKSMLINNFNEGTCVSAKPENVVAGGKTSTAETGWIDADGERVLHSWFAGFAEKGEKIYTIVVFKEDGISGAGDCGPVFREIAQRICE